MGGHGTQQRRNLPSIGFNREALLGLPEDYERRLHLSPQPDSDGKYADPDDKRAKKINLKVMNVTFNSRPGVKDYLKHLKQASKTQRNKFVHQLG